MGWITDLTLELPRNPQVPFVERPLSALRWVAVHHTAGPWNQSARSIAEYHIRPRPGAPKGWSGIAYHYLVRRDGMVEKVRPVRFIPACVGGHNTALVCVAFVGSFQAARPSEEAWQAAEWLAALLRKEYPTILGVRGHREFEGQATACPGRAFDLDAFRAGVDSRAV